MSGFQRPGPDDISAAARDRMAKLLADLKRDRDDLAAAGESAGVAAVDDLIDAARRVLDNLDRSDAAG